MIVTFAAIRAKKKADEAREAARLEKRRGYDAAGRARRKAKALADAGLSDLPASVQAQIEQTAETVVPAPEPVKIVDATVEELIARLTSIRERLFWLASVWATTLSDDVYHEAEKYRRLFRELGDRLHDLDPAAVDRIVAGHEAILLSDPTPARPTLPLAAQQWFELAGEVRSRRMVRVEPEKPDGYVSDGLQGFL
jgi:hypothetical protein